MQKSHTIWCRVFSPRLLTCIAIGLAGCLAIYNATFHKEQPFYFVSRQLIWLVIGITILLICSHITPDTYARWTFPLSGIALLVLYALLLWGTRVNGTQGWFVINTTFLGTVYFQPSEIGKPIFVLFLAKIFMSDQKMEHFGIKPFIRHLSLTSLWLIPILLQPNFSSFLLLMMIFSIIYWLHGGKLVHLLSLFLACIFLVLVQVHTKQFIPNRLFKALNFKEENALSNHPHSHFRTTLAYGGLWGRNPEQTLWSKAYVPLGYSDSIFATLGESIGFIGVVPVVLGILLWLIYCIHIAQKQTSTYRAMIVVGIATMFVAQAFIHISVTLDILPPIGTSLPMFSYGGSSLVATLASIGIIFSVANKRETSIEIADR